MKTRNKLIKLKLFKSILSSHECYLRRGSIQMKCCGLEGNLREADRNKITDNEKMALVK